ncbi:MAG: SRPBCC family protein [Myxococcaceae bacterium]
MNTRIDSNATPMKNYTNPLQAFFKLKTDFPQWFHSSSKTEANSRPWPAGLEPAKASVFAHNETFIPLPPDQVFASLTDATKWPTYYPNASDVKLPDGKTRLEPGMQFTWSTFGAKQNTTVKEFEPGKALAWEADSPGTKAYHRWILEAAPGGTRLITEEVQKGPTAMLDQLVMNPGLHAAHQLWLERLKQTLAPNAAAGWVSR